MGADCATAWPAFPNQMMFRFIESADKFWPFFAYAKLGEFFEKKSFKKLFIKKPRQKGGTFLSGRSCLLSSGLNGGGFYLVINISFEFFEIFDKPCP